MRKTFRAAGALLLLAVVFTSCQKSSHTDDTVDPSTLSLDEKSLVVAAGFNGNWAHKTADGKYMIEGDILLSKSELQEMVGATPTNNIIVANEEHYRTFNLVTVPASGFRTITVRLTGSFPAQYSTGLDQAIARYNAISGLRIRFSRVAATSSADITINIAPLGTSGGGCILGGAGFPSGGNPYPAFTLSNSPCAVSFFSTANKVDEVIAHELGHCIGFRHTDYMNRSSCGQNVNEGQVTTGVGAVHIPGTPTTVTGSYNSWMMACVNNSPVITSTDIVALQYVY